MSIHSPQTSAAPAISDSSHPRARSVSWLFADPGRFVSKSNRSKPAPAVHRPHDRADEPAADLP